MHIFVGFGIGMLFLFIFAVILGGFFMWIAAKIAGVEKSTFGRAIVAAISSSIISLLMAFFFSFVPLLGNAVGFIIGLILTVLVIKGAFDTSFSKALLVWIFNVIAAVIALLLTTIIVAGTFAFLPVL